MMSLIFGILNITQMSLFMKQKQTHRHREQNCGCKGGRSGGWMDWEFGVSRCKLIHTEWRKNKVLLYSSGNHIPYPVVNHDGKECEKDYI